MQVLVKLRKISLSLYIDRLFLRGPRVPILLNFLALLPKLLFQCVNHRYRQRASQSVGHKKGRARRLIMREISMIVYLFHNFMYREPPGSRSRGRSQCTANLPVRGIVGAKNHFALHSQPRTGGSRYSHSREPGGSRYTRHSREPGGSRYTRHSGEPEVCPLDAAANREVRGTPVTAANREVRGTGSRYSHKNFLFNSARSSWVLARME